LVPYPPLPRPSYTPFPYTTHFRSQSKTGRMFRGAVYFRPHRLRAARRETGWQRRVTDYKGEVDYFGVYCPEMDAVYLVPIGDIRSEEHTSESSHVSISYAVFCLKK